MRITAIIADDEPVLREHLQDLLAKEWHELVITGEAGNGDEAVRLAGELHPDIAFLDIRMPKKSGLETAAEISGFCRIVFVTAYDEYAIEAFEKQAVDYLLKPVSAERLAVTTDRLKHDLHGNRKLSDQLITELLQRLDRSQPEPAPPYLQWLKVGRGDGVRLINVDEICYCQAEDKYTRVVTLSGEELIRTSIKKLAQSLDPERFWRIHRATIVRVAAIRHATRSFTGRYRIHLKNHSDILTASRTYTHLFKRN